MKTRSEQSIARRNTARAARYRIESETVTIAEIAARLGVHRTVAEVRMSRLRGASGPITWSRLALLDGPIARRDAAQAIGT